MVSKSQLQVLAPMKVRKKPFFLVQFLDKKDKQQ